MEWKLPEEKTKEDLLTALSAFELQGKLLESPPISKTKTGTYFIRPPLLTNEEHNALLAHAKETLGSVQELQFTTIGSTVGSNLKKRAAWALAIATVAIILYIAFAFRSVPRNMSPWRFGVSAIIALIHDITIVMGVFTILSQFTTFQADTLFVSALLSIMGYSVSDTIVIFDRIRENLALSGKYEEFPTIAERSLRQTLSRTLNTGLGSLMMLFALFFLGSESIRWFIFALIIGTIIGTYSSFFVATPILIFWKKKE